MATPTQNQPYAYPTPSSEPRATPNQGQAQFDKYCIIHIATTCDEHGVYVTKDSAEVIEIGWVVVDAKDPSLPEVRTVLSMCRRLVSRHDAKYGLTPADTHSSCTTSLFWSALQTLPSPRCARPLPP